MLLLIIWKIGNEVQSKREKEKKKKKKKRMRSLG
jgi:hypothetical protein